MYSISIQHGLPGEDKSLGEVFRETKLLFRARGRREFVAAELSDYVKRIALSGPSSSFEESIEGQTVAREALKRFKAEKHSAAHADVS